MRHLAAMQNIQPSIKVHAGTSLLLATAVAGPNKHKLMVTAMPATLLGNAQRKCALCACMALAAAGALTSALLLTTNSD
jgi:hypothetical protein